MPLIVLGNIPEGTCYPPELQPLLELFAEHLDVAIGSSGGTFKTLYIQSTQPQGVPEETIWFNPVDKSLQFYGKAPGDAGPSWMMAVIPDNTLTGDQLKPATITARELSPDILAQLSAVAAATANAVLNFETFHGGGSAGANFFIMVDGSLRATGKSKYTYATVDRYKNGTGFVTSADSSVLPKRCGFFPPRDNDPVAKVYCMQAATFVITAAGNVYSTGLNLNGQLGVGDTTDRVIFQRIDPSYFNSESVTELAIGTADGAAISCYALTAAGKVYSWGNNYYGQLGLGGVTTGNTNQPSTPTLISGLNADNAQIVSAGSGSTAGVPAKIAVYVRKNDGTVYGCGWNGDGNLGLGSTTHQSTFVQVDSTNLTSVSQIAAAGDGDHITFYAVRTTGATAATIRACGYNNKGQVGNGNATTPQTTTQLALTLTDNLVSDLRVFASVGNFSAFAVLSDGTMRNWGSNATKQLALGSGAGTSNVLSPAVPTVQDTSGNILFVQNVRVGGSGGKISSAVMARIFTGYDPAAPQYHVMTAGSNQFGQLGLGSTTDTDTFTRVLIDTTLVAGVQFGASCSGPTNNLSALLIRLTNGIAMACGYDAAAIGQLGADATPASISVAAVVNF